MSVEALKKFHWEVQPAAQKLVNELVSGFLARCPRAADLASRMQTQTATRFADWVDTIEVQRTEELRKRLLDVGFSHRPRPGAADCFVHEGAIFPVIVLRERAYTNVWVKVDFVADFVAAHQISPDTAIEGEPWSPMRKALVFHGEACGMTVVERHGYRGYSLPVWSAEKSVLAMRHLEALRRRRREWPTEEEAFAHTNAIVDAAIADLGVAFTCDLFFHGERDYWERRNQAAQFQHHRQNLLGLGWANHDHHTYRCSRRNYVAIIALLEKLGFHCRERFYAGAEAGWGAQVLEEPVTGITIFADVDMAPEEVLGDFAHEPFAEKNELSTVGLWAELHGEAMLEAGMHHLECQFDHAALTKQLAEHGIGMMGKFTNFEYLTQAFTEGDWWPVREANIAKLLKRGQITAEQAEQFRKKGALGSHLENLERNDGFKGFNQHGVSDIIKRTDARLQLQGA